METPTRIGLAVVALAIIIGLFVVLARENLRLTAVNLNLSEFNRQLVQELEDIRDERDELKRRLDDELTKHPVTLTPGLVKPSAPLGETRWVGDRYIVIPPVPPTPPGKDDGLGLGLPLSPGYVPDVDGTVINQAPAVKYDPKRDGVNTVHPVPPVPQAHPVTVPGYDPADKR